MGLSQQRTTAEHMLLGFDTVPDKLLSVWLVHWTQRTACHHVNPVETKRLYNDSREHKTSPHVLPTGR